MKALKKPYNKPSVVTANAFEATHGGKLVPVLVAAAVAAASAAGYAAGRSITNAIKIDSFSKVIGLTPVLKAS